MVVRRNSFFSPVSDDATSLFRIQVRTLIACQTEDTNLNSHDMCKIESVPDTFTIPRKNAAYLKRKEEGRQKMFAGVHPDGVFKSGWCWKWLSRVPCCVLNLVDYTNGDWERTWCSSENFNHITFSCFNYITQIYMNITRIAHSCYKKIL